MSARARRAVICVGVLVVLITFAFSFRDVHQNVGYDLRLRVVAARSMMAGFDPYYDRLVAGPDGMPLRPARAFQAWSLCGYPPSLLLLYAIPSNLPYPIQRHIWFAAEWSAMAATVLLLVRLCRTRPEKFLQLVLCLYFFMGTYFWRLHVERGQYYIFVVLAEVVGVTACMRGRRRGDWLASLAFGLGAAMRLNWIFLAVPLVIFKRWRVAIGMTLVWAAVLLITLPITGIGGWKSFFEEFNICERDAIDSGATRAVKSAGVPLIQIEGNLPDTVMYGNTVNESIYEVLVKLDDVRKAMLNQPREPYDAATIERFRLVAHGLAFVYVIAFVLMCWWLQRTGAPTRLKFACGMVFLVGLDYFVPTHWSYVDVLLLLPMPLLMRSVIRTGPMALLIFFIIGLVIGGEFIVGLPVKATAIARAVGVYGGFLWMLAIVAFHTPQRRLQTSA